MNIPYLTADGIYIAICDLATRGVPPFYIVNVPSRCVYVLWVFMVAQEAKAWTN